MGYEDGELHVKYLGREYDVTRFRKFHPGGANTLSWFRGGDITQQLVHTHHSEAAYSLLEDYRADGRPTEDKDEVSHSTVFGAVRNSHFGLMGHSKYALCPLQQIRRMCPIRSKFEFLTTEFLNRYYDTFKV